MKNSKKTNELPTFGNLKAGDHNPFAVQMEVSTPYGVAEVNDCAPGPLVKIITRAGSCLTCGYDEDGHQTGPFSINDILPSAVTASKPLTMEDIKVGETYQVREDLDLQKDYGGYIPGKDALSFAGQNVEISCVSSKYAIANNSISVWTPEMLTRLHQQPHTYQFGDKVKALGCEKPYYFISQTKGFCVVLFAEEEYPDLETYLEENTKNGFDTLMCTANEVSPWPEPVRMFLDNIDGGIIPTIVGADYVLLGRRKITFDSFDKIAAVVAQKKEQ